ncbi:MAG: flagellar hook-basal body complex protein [Planctomycetales bacterium]|nr:flagellar hook-basal body complex protein [Planctomycetales bacterium]
MPNSLLTGVSGLLAHQRLLDIVGHNIANANTVGFKAQRVLFSDLFYEVINPATSGGDGDSGGVNPNEIGGGVQLAMTDRKFAQGGLTSTGEQFDVAISGGGFFVVDNGIETFLTRAGLFSLDANDILVAPGGMRVQRVAGVGEFGPDQFGFQIAGDSSIHIPLGSAIPGEETQTVALAGNLDADTTGLQEEIRFSAPFQVDGPSGQVPATGATLLSDIITSSGTFGGSDEIRLSGLDTDDSPVSASIAIDGTSTLQDLVDLINANYAGITADINGDGGIELMAVEPGPTDFSVKFDNAPSNSFNINFTQHLLNNRRQEGKNADIVIQSVAVYDERGGRHDIELEFEKVDDDTWTMVASIDPAEGEVTDNVIEEIVFNDDGSWRGSSDTQLLVNLVGFDDPLALNFVFEDETTGITLNHRPSKSNLTITQDGSEPGSLVSVNIDIDGYIKGISSNGRTITLAQLAVASVANPKGLSAIGDNLYQTTLNSGEPQIGLAGAGDRGTLVGGQLESSNVDLAYEFTRLIVAQRGFSANARTITISDEMLEELSNIIR